MVDKCKITDWLTIQINRQQNVLECGALLPLVWNMHFKKIQTGALLPVLDALNNCDDTSMVSVQVWQNVWMKTFNFNEWMVLRPQHSCSFWQASPLQFWKMYDRHVYSLRACAPWNKSQSASIICTSSFAIFSRSLRWGCTVVALYCVSLLHRNCVQCVAIRCNYDSWYFSWGRRASKCRSWLWGAFRQQWWESDSDY